jgi:O-antigen/teichoic acid export membrane protein
MKQSQRIARNITLLLSSELVGFGILFCITVLIARYLGSTGFGYYSFVLAFVGLFQLIAESGLGTILIREIAVDRKNLPSLLGSSKSLIWILSIAVLALILLTASFISMEDTVRKATFIMGAAVLATVHAMGYNSVFRAMEEFEYNAIGFVLHKVILLTLTVIVIKFRLGLVEIALSYLVSNVTLWFFYYLVVRRRYLRPKMSVNINQWKRLISEAAPIGIASILRKISWQVDILILSAMGTAASVGLFSAPYKIIHAFNMISGTLAIPLFPFFSRLAKVSTEDVFHACEKNLKFLFIISIPLTVILTALSYPIVSMVYGEKFLNSHSALQILGFVLLFLFPSSQFLYIFSALGKQKLYTVSSFLSLILNIVLDLILIPKLDFIGACIGTLVAESALFGISLYFIKSMSSDFSLVRASWKPAVSGAIMALVLYQFNGFSILELAAGTGLAILIYIVSNIFLKSLSRSELNAIKESIRFVRKVPGTSVPDMKIK